MSTSYSYPGSENFKNPKVIGFEHFYDENRLSRIKKRLEQDWKPDIQVGIECSYTLEELEDGQNENPGKRLVYEICRFITEKGGSFIFVEDKRAHDREGEIYKKYDFDDEGIRENTEDWNELVDLVRTRSRTMIYQSYAGNCDLLLIGSTHAYDISRMGYNNIEFLDPVDEFEKMIIENADKRPAQLLLPKRFE
jgi:hypothetical protein